MKDSDLSDDDRDQYEREWDDLTERDLLEGIFIELTQIRALLSERETGGSDGASVYECTKCEAVVKPEEREEHAARAHSAPPGMLESLFEEKQ